ncbi:inositol monophosphatase family protein [Citromicrobium bathyomarinum]|uniref:inositol monophosphatase family protein n=1 Tax=Citromicrobium bathyomarinum TaxID=72174 RepID=UPI00315B3EBF
MSVLDREVLALMRDVAERIIMPRHRALKATEIIEKADDDLVTIADREAEVALAEGLAKLHPEAAIVGEEAVHADPSVMDRLSGTCWIIDPIDGTANFASGSGHFGIMIALAEGGAAQAGWIYDPQRDRLCAAHLGQGATVDGEQVLARSSGANPPRLAAMTKFMAPDQRSRFETEILPHYTPVQAPGAACEQYPLTVLGEHDLAIYERTLPWDHAAGNLFLNEAGGTCLRLDGSPYRVDDGRRGMIGAANRALYDQLVARLAVAGYQPAT